MRETTTFTGTEPIERTLELRASPERVWRAITDPDELTRWFPDRIDVEMAPAAVGTMTWNQYGSYAIGVDAVEPMRYLAWRWAEEPDTPLEKATVTLVEWWLDPREDGGTTLRLKESGFVSPERRAGNDEGWTEELAELSALIDS